MAGAVAANAIEGETVVRDWRAVASSYPEFTARPRHPHRDARTVSPGAHVIAIDGPAGSGKSTVARGVAAALGLPTLDTGAMYRAVTLAALEAGVDLGDGDAVAAVARAADIELDDGRVRARRPRRARRDPRARGHRRGVAGVVAPARCARCSSTVSGRGSREHGGGVVEGRDIGTVVLPDAPVKVFITARDDVRAARRQRDEVAAARTRRASTTCSDALDGRDRADATLGRATRPEDAAADAIVIDTSDVAAADVIARGRRPGRAGASRDVLPVRARHRAQRVQGGVPGAGGREGARPDGGRVHRRAVAPVDPRHPVRRVHHAAHGALPGQGRPVRDPLGAPAVRRARRGRGRAGHRRPRRAARARGRARGRVSRWRSSPRAPGDRGPRSASCSTAPRSSR